MLSVPHRTYTFAFLILSATDRGDCYSRFNASLMMVSIEA